MEAKSITVQDLRNLASRRLSVQMPNFAAAVSTRNLVSYVRKAYPLPKGLNYETNTVELDNGGYEITISIIGKEKL